MNYLGDYAEDGTLDFIWSTNDGNGASITRATNGTISVYRANSTTQSNAGITDTEDFDGLTGVHHCRVVLTNAFYTIANDYMIVLSAATIDGQTVNTVLAHFSIENRFMVGTNNANTTTPNTVTPNTVTPLTAAQVNAEIDTALSDIHLDHLLANAYDPASKPGAADALLNELIENDGGISRYTANALEQAPTGGSAPTAAAIADAVWDEATPDHTTPLSFGAEVQTHALSAELPSEPPTVAAIADQVWDEATADHQTAGSTGRALTDATAPTLAQFFDTDSGETAGTAVSGSVVGEIVASITGGGIPGSTEITDITIDDGTNPLEGAAVWINTNNTDSTANVLWLGNTNASGNPKDSNNSNPFLDAGTYYIWAQLGGYTFTNPTTLLVGAGPFTISGSVIASPGSVTAQQLIDQIQTDLADPLAATWSESDLLQWLNDAIRDFSLAHPRRRNTSITAVSSQHKYTLPDDHIDTFSVEYPSAQTPPEYLLEKPYTDLDFWTNDDHYATIHNDDQEEDNELWIAATPTGSQSIAIEYAAYHPHTLALADNTTVPIEFHHVLKVFVMARATEYLQMKEQATPTSSSSLLMSMLAQNAQQLRAEYDRRKQRGRRRRRNREDENV